MAQTAWEKPLVIDTAPRSKINLERFKYLIGGVLILSAVIYLMISGTISGARYYITVDQLLTSPDYLGQTVRVSGAVIGSSISNTTEIINGVETQVIEFDVANVPENYTDLGQALHDAVNNPNAELMRVRVEGQPMPDLLQHEAQAILSGTMGSDGVFRASELLLKCPSRMMEDQPDLSPADSGA
ncbi:MAG: cytochrome c maturation protein CcmE [Anaerolineae bacterium]